MKARLFRARKQNLITTKLYIVWVNTYRQLRAYYIKRFSVDMDCLILKYKKRVKTFRRGMMCTRNKVE